MIKNAKLADFGPYEILKINSGKFQELLKVFEMDSASNCLTLFTEISDLPSNVGAIYLENSDFELAFEKFLQHS